MNEKMIPLIMLSLLLISRAPAMAQPVDVALTADRTEFMLGEPVVVLVALTNKGQEPLSVSPQLGPEGGNLEYRITGPDGQEKAFSPLFVEDRANFRTLAQGETVRGAARIFYGGNGFSFPDPGTYSVVASYRDSRSSPLRLKVLPPQTNAEREQARLILGQNEVGLFLMLEGGDELAEAQKNIEQLTSRYPDALLTSYVRYAVARNLSVPARNFVSKKPRPAEIPRSISILQSLTDRNMVLYYQAGLVTTLSSLLSKTNRTEEARSVLQQFQSRLSKMENVRPYFMPEIEQRLKNMK
jgi:hypothetical protein